MVKRLALLISFLLILIFSLVSVSAVTYSEATISAFQDQGNWDYGGGRGPEKMYDNNEASYAITSSGWGPGSYAKGLFTYRAPTNAIDYIASLLMINGTWTNYSSVGSIPDDGVLLWIWSSNVTVPVFLLGSKPRGPKIFANLPTIPIRSGVATA